jgi:hypothetical protein
MKKIIILLTTVAVVGVGSYVVFAKGHMGGTMSGRRQAHGMMDSNDMMMQKGMMGKEMMGQQHGMVGMHPMSGMMCSSSLVATQDGGVIVLVGDKLLKYDKDLNLVKEAELKIDTKKCGKKIEQS